MLVFVLHKECGGCITVWWRIVWMLRQGTKGRGWKALRSKTTYLFPCRVKPRAQRRCRGSGSLVSKSKSPYFNLLWGGFQLIPKELRKGSSVTSVGRGVLTLGLQYVPRSATRVHVLFVPWFIFLGNQICARNLENSSTADKGGKLDLLGWICQENCVILRHWKAGTCSGASRVYRYDLHVGKSEEEKAKTGATFIVRVVSCLALLSHGEFDSRWMGNLVMQEYLLL